MPEGLRIVKKRQIPESDKSVLELRNKIQSERMRQVIFFSGRKRNQEYIAKEEAVIEDLKHTNFHEYQKRKELLDATKSEESIDRITYSVKDMIASFYHRLRDEKNSTGVKKYYHNVANVVFGKNVEEKDFLDAYVAIEKDQLSTETIMTLADRYTNLLEDEERRFAETVRIVKEDFLIRVKKAVEDGWLPSSVLPKLDRLNFTKVVLEEPSTASHRGWDGSSENFGLIAISAEYLQPGNEPTLESILSHEFIHEISGLGFYTTTSKMGTFENTQSTRYKVGLQSASLHNGRWINEATTMFLNRKLGYDDKGYPGLLDRFLPLMKDSVSEEGVISKGIDETKLFEAYFESWEEKDGKKVNPAESKFRELVNEVNRVYKERFNDPVGWISFSRGLTQVEYLESLRKTV